MGAVLPSPGAYCLEKSADRQEARREEGPHCHELMRYRRFILPAVIEEFEGWVAEHVEAPAANCAPFAGCACVSCAEKEKKNSGENCARSIRSRDPNNPAPPLPRLCIPRKRETGIAHGRQTTEGAAGTGGETLDPTVRQRRDEADQGSQWSSQALQLHPTPRTSSSSSSS